MADMADMLKSFSSMMEGKQIPDNIKEMLNSLQNNSAQNGANTGNNTTANTTDSNMNSYVNQANSSEATNSSLRNVSSFFCVVTSLSLRFRFLS